LHRLNTRKDNDFGKEKTEQERTLNRYKGFEAEMLKRGATPINTEATVTVVADQFLSLIKPQ